MSTRNQRSVSDCLEIDFTEWNYDFYTSARLGLTTNNRNFLIKSARDSREYIRTCAAGNINIPVEAMNILVNDESEQVLGSLSNNPNLFSIYLGILVYSKFSYVRLGVVRNKHSELEVLKMLLQDQDEMISELAAWRLDGSKPILTSF